MEEEQLAPKLHIKTGKGRPRLYTEAEAKERLKIHQRKYIEKNRAKVKWRADKYAVEYYAENRQNLIIKSRARYMLNKDEIKKKAKENFESMKKITVPTEAQMKRRIKYEKSKEKKKQYYLENREKILKAANERYLAIKEKKNVL
jgi:hypothetical protein